ncbi:MAG: hypothetical protein HKN13_10005 [Rhodothermales bacterium]|nr:hypothetical protein [Rhodothermales bacterium]
MTKILLFVKHNIPVLWLLIEWLNALLFSLLHRAALLRESEACFREFSLDGYAFRSLDESDLDGLFNLLHRQQDGRLDYFTPHKFDRKSLQRAAQNSAFLMFGVFCREELVGYFFLRCFWNRKCFVGRLIDEPHERKGIGRLMNRILYNTAWRSGFRCYTTVSKDNALVIRSHERNPAAHLLKELPNDYLLIEFTRPSTWPG